MTIVALNLPLPVLNGPGAAVDVSTVGGPLTFTCVGSFPGSTIAIEISNNGGLTYSPLYVFQAQAETVQAVAAEFVRCNVSGRKAAVPARPCSDPGTLQGDVCPRRSVWEMAATAA